MSIAAKTLCERLIFADQEDEVVKILEQAGYWAESNCWRDLGDMENNFSTAGAQQSDPVAALVEKIVNAADARLMNECYLAGIDPEGDKAPPSVRHAVAQFIQKSAHPENETNGLIENMSPTERSEQAKKITLVTTGSNARPSITIVDEGEGQTPERIPFTFLSLNKSNKLRVPFVQGRFNMGGTGALRFCGNLRMQLIVTRRNPDIPAAGHQDDANWSFTVVRRETPTTGERNSVYRYLAPIDANSERKGRVLRFISRSLKVKPAGKKAYVDDLQYGSLVKLYEYNFKDTSNILMRDGVLRQVDVRLPSPALPIMFHECRAFRGHSGSFSNPCTGLSVRLADNRAGNVEDGFPYDDVLTVDGQEFSIRFFGFKAGRAKTYLNKSEGVLFVVNGQTQGVLPARFYTRQGINFSYISDSLLTRVDCSKLDQWAHEELFMNTRESLADSDFRRRVERALQKRIGESQALKDFNHRRRSEKIKEKIKDDQTMEEVLKSVMKKSPALSALFLTGDRLTDLTATAPVNTKNIFNGEEFPTYFHFRNRKPGSLLARRCELGREVRIPFDTDAENNYFGRAKEKGRYSVFAADKSLKSVKILNHSMSLYNGTATLRLDMPTCEVGDRFRLKVLVTDNSRIDPFVNEIEATITPFIEREGGTGRRRKAPSKEQGGDRLAPSGLSLPHVEWVYRKDWEAHELDKFSALKIVQSDEAQSSSQRTFDFFINAENIYLQKELEKAKGNEALLKEQFKVGLVLVGLALIHEAGEAADGQGIADSVAHSTRAMAMMLIPMINYLGDLDPEDMKAELAA